MVWTSIVLSTFASLFTLQSLGWFKTMENQFKVIYTIQIGTITLALFSLVLVSLSWSFDNIMIELALLIESVIAVIWATILDLVTNVFMAYPLYNASTVLQDKDASLCRQKLGQLVVSIVVLDGAAIWMYAFNSVSTFAFALGLISIRILVSLDLARLCADYQVEIDMKKLMQNDGPRSSSRRGQSGPQSGNMSGRSGSNMSRGSQGMDSIDASQLSSIPPTSYSPWNKEFPRGKSKAASHPVLRMPA
jgi:hypothetical protein